MDDLSNDRIVTTDSEPIVADTVPVVAGAGLTSPQLAAPPGGIGKASISLL